VLFSNGVQEGCAVYRINEFLELDYQFEQNILDNTNDLMTK